MYNIHDSIALLGAAERALASPLLNADEKLSFLDEIVAQIPHEFSRSQHVAVVYAAIQRAQEQRRPAQGKQDKAPVAKGTNEASEGSSEGLQEQAENSGRSADGDADSASDTAAPTEAKRPTQSQSRKGKPR